MPIRNEATARLNVDKIVREIVELRENGLSHHDFMYLDDALIQGRFHDLKKFVELFSASNEYQNNRLAQINFDILLLLLRELDSSLVG